MVIDGSKSDLLSVTSGVPQGSVLGPVLFLVYINDLAISISHCTVKLFADDCKIYIGISRDSNSNALMQEDINSL